MMEEKKVSLFTCIISMVMVLATILISLRAGINPVMAVLLACVVSIAIAFALKTKWADIQSEFEKCLLNCMNPMVILILIGTLVGIWMIGGGIATLVYYGLKFVSPSIVVPTAFLLCAITSLFTGTSFGSIATMGLALFGVGVNLGIPAALMAGAVVSGACWGDKLSPLSDTTNLSPAMSGTDLYSHIRSMFYTTLPATAVALIAYIILGIKFGGQSSYDASEVRVMLDTLQANYNINIMCLIPMLLLLVLSALKVPATLAMLISVVVSAVVAVITQGVAVDAIFACALRGFKSETGLSLVDKILSRGGAVSMIGTISSMILGSMMAGALRASGILFTIMEVLTKAIKSSTSLIITTLLTSWIVLCSTGNQMVGILIPGQLMRDLYDKYNVNRKVLSRSLEDASTMTANLIPWTTPAVYAMTTLGVGLEYIPYTILNYTVPIFAVICAITGFGVWDSKGNPIRNSKTEGESYDAI